MYISTRVSKTRGVKCLHDHRITYDQRGGSPISGKYTNKELSRTRKHQVRFWVNDKELAAIAKQQKRMHITNRAAYLRKMAMDGYCITMDMTDIRELIRLLRICSNNLNQYAKVANTTGAIYAEDIADVQQRLDQIWDRAGGILEGLAAIP